MKIPVPGLYKVNMHVKNIYR